MNLYRALFLYFITMTAAIAGPGAHGPDGQHLDAPSGHAAVGSAARIIASTESFELVGHLHDGEFAILIDRFETNEPVLDAKLEVEYNGLTANARFHPEHGDYGIDDPKLLQALAQPGEHALVFTLTAGPDSDLLEGVLVVPDHHIAQVHSHGHRHGPHAPSSRHGLGLSLATWGIIGGLLAIILTAIVIVMLRRESAGRK